MMKMLMSAAVAASIVGAAGAVQAQQAEPEGPVLKAFTDICVTAAGDEDRAIGLADGLGWKTIDPAELTSGEPNPGARARSKRAGDAELLLIVEVSPPEAEDEPSISNCILMAVPRVAGGAVLPDPVQATADWIGMYVHPEFTSDQADGYAFTVESDGSRRSLQGRSEIALAQAMLTGNLHIILAGTDADQTARLVYATPDTP